MLAADPPRDLTSTQVLQVGADIRSNVIASWSTMLAPVCEAASKPTKPVPTPIPKKAKAPNLGIYSKLYRKLKKIVVGLETLKGDDYQKVENPPYMPLSVEVLSRDGDKLTIALMHTYVQNGDLMRDPDVEFGVNVSTKAAEPLVFQQSAPPVYTEVYRDGMVNPAAKRDLARFADQWLTNLKNQGFRAVFESPTNTAADDRRREQQFEAAEVAAITEVLEERLRKGLGPTDAGTIARKAKLPTARARYLLGAHVPGVTSDLPTPGISGSKTFYRYEPTGIAQDREAEKAKIVKAIQYRELELMGTSQSRYPMNAAQIARKTKLPLKTVRSWLESTPQFIAEPGATGPHVHYGYDPYAKPSPAPCPECGETMLAPGAECSACRAKSERQAEIEAERPKTHEEKVLFEAMLQAERGAKAINKRAQSVFDRNVAQGRKDAVDDEAFRELLSRYAASADTVTLGRVAAELDWTVDKAEQVLSGFMMFEKPTGRRDMADLQIDITQFREKTAPTPDAGQPDAPTEAIVGAVVDATMATTFRYFLANETNDEQTLRSMFLRDVFPDIQADLYEKYGEAVMNPRIEVMSWAKVWNQRDVPSTPSEEPDLETPGLRALYELLGQDEEKARRVHDAVLSSRYDDWRGNIMKERAIQRAIYDELDDESATKRAFDIVKREQEYGVTPQTLRADEIKLEQAIARKGREGGDARAEKIALGVIREQIDAVAPPATTLTDAHVQELRKLADWARKNGAIWKNELVQIWGDGRSYAVGVDFDLLRELKPLGEEWLEGYTVAPPDPSPPPPPAKKADPHSTLRALLVKHEKAGAGERMRVRHIAAELGWTDDEVWTIAHELGLEVDPQGNDWFIRLNSLYPEKTEAHRLYKEHRINYGSYTPTQQEAFRNRVLEFVSELPKTISDEDFTRVQMYMDTLTTRITDDENKFAEAMDEAWRVREEGGLLELDPNQKPKTYWLGSVAGGELLADLESAGADRPDSSLVNRMERSAKWSKDGKRVKLVVQNSAEAALLLWSLPNAIDKIAGGSLDLPPAPTHAVMRSLARFAEKVGFDWPRAAKNPKLWFKHEYEYERLNNPRERGTSHERIRAKLLLGETMMQPEWSAGPYQKADGTEGFAIIMRDGTLLQFSDDANVIAKIAGRLARNDRSSLGPPHRHAVEPDEQIEDPDWGRVPTQPTRGRRKPNREDNPEPPIVPAGTTRSRDDDPILAAFAEDMAADRQDNPGPLALAQLVGLGAAAAEAASLITG